MEDTELFQIGDVAKLFHLSVGTLRHYEQYGILKPEYTDKKQATDITVYASLRCLQTYAI